MGKYHLTGKAVEDLSNIWNYTSDTWSENQADDYYLMLLHFCEVLADKRKIGKKYEEVKLNVLGYKVSQHIIFYRFLSDKEIEVVRILHSRMDIKGRLKG